MLVTLALAASLVAADPSSATASEPSGPTGAAALAVGGVGKVLGLSAGIVGVALGGSPGLLLTTASLGPSALAGGLLVTGAWLRGRHHARTRGPALVHRVRPARRAGWALVGVGAGLLVGTSVALAVWPFEPAVDDGAAARYPGAFAGVGAVFCVAPLAIGSGASAVTWAASHVRHAPRTRARRAHLIPSVAGLRVVF